MVDGVVHDCRVMSHLRGAAAFAYPHVLDFSEFEHRNWGSVMVGYAPANKRSGRDRHHREVNLDQQLRLISVWPVNWRVTFVNMLVATLWDCASLKATSFTIQLC
jgi:hypothetical protein